MINLDKFQAHIILLCKGHYDYKDFFEALERIWAIRCGYNYEDRGPDILSYIANDMLDIISKCKGSGYILNQLFHNLHDRLNKYSYSYKVTYDNTIKSVIDEYRAVICNLKVKEKEKEGDNYKTIINIPVPQPELFNKIISGKGEYSDYNLVK